MDCANRQAPSMASGGTMGSKNGVASYQRPDELRLLGREDCAVAGGATTVATAIALDLGREDLDVALGSSASRESGAAHPDHPHDLHIEVNRRIGPRTTW